MLCAMGNPVSPVVSGHISARKRSRKVIHAISISFASPKIVKGTSTIAFASLEKTALQLDTLVSEKNGAIAVDVYRKPTHTDRCLDYNSHHDSNHKASTATTLLHRNSMIYSYLPKGKSGNLVETMQLWSPTIIHLNLFRTY